MICRPSAWADHAELEQTAATSVEFGLMLSANRTDGWALHIYEAVDADTPHEHARCVGMPGDDILPIGATAVVRPDPD